MNRLRGFVAVGMALTVFGAMVAPIEAQSRGRSRAGAGKSSHVSSRGGGGSRAVASGRAGYSGASRGAAVRGRASYGRGSRAVVRGRATYGYGYGGFYGRPYGGFYGYPYWGGPFFGDPFWGYSPFYFGLGFGYPYGSPYYGGVYPAREVVVADGSGGIGIVETDIRPKSAEVWVDGQWVGKARDYDGRWDELFVSTGVRQVEFRRDGYQTLRLYLDVPRGGYLKIDERLAKGEGLDPRSHDTPPPTRRPTRTATPPAPRPQPRLDISADATRPGALQTGLLRLVVVQDEASITLDGEFLARGAELRRLHGALPLAAGTHTLEITLDGYPSRRVRVDVEADRTTELQIDLSDG